MTLLNAGAARQINTTDPTVFAFKIDGHVDDDAAEAMASVMNEAFDRFDTVNMLLDLSTFDGRDWDRLLEPEIVRSRLRSLTKVKRYAVVGAPDRAATMISYVNAVIPVDAQAFSRCDADGAWAFVGARPA